MLPSESFQESSSESFLLLPFRSLKFRSLRFLGSIFWQSKFSKFDFFRFLFLYVQFLMNSRFRLGYHIFWFVFHLVFLSLSKGWWHIVQGTTTVPELRTRIAKSPEISTTGIASLGSCTPHQPIITAICSTSIVCLLTILIRQIITYVQNRVQTVNGK